MCSLSIDITQIIVYTIITVKGDNRQAKVVVQSPRGTRKEYKVRARQDRKVAGRKSDSQTAPRRLPDKQKRRQTQ